MNSNLKKASVITVILLLTISVTPLTSGISLPSNPSSSEVVTLENTEEIELVLLRAEHFLYLQTTENISMFNVKYVFPPEYGYQTPIFLEILDDTNAEIVDYKIEDDILEPNKFVNFTINSIDEGEQPLIHFNYWVLVKNHNFSDLPKSLKIPELSDLPNETKEWLQPTEVVQSNKLRIKLRARQMKFLTNNLLKVSSRIAKFVMRHRYFFFLFQYTFGTYRSQDALTTLTRNGECPGRSHLSCALFRANGVPARVILAAPDYEIWYEIHCMVEYYSPEYGWILSDVHNAQTPFEPKHQIIQRICYPEDENNTQTDYIYKRMKGVERWIWIDNESVSPYYNKLKEDSSRSRGHTEADVFVEEMIGNDTISLTQEVYHKFEYYLGLHLTGSNRQHFQNAMSYQLDALNEFRDSNDVFHYLYYMCKAKIEYNQITV